jgi:hypothetical protein
MNARDWVAQDAIELVEVFLLHHTGQRKMSEREIFNACYNAGRVTGRHNNPRVRIYDDKPITATPSASPAG